MHHRQWLLRPKKKAPAILIRKSPPGKSTKHTTSDKQKLNNWFQYQHQHAGDWLCENCGAPLDHFDEKVRRSHHAHILPKKIFKSVADHPNNHLLLGGMFSPCGCHYAFDASWERASRMHVFQIAKDKFLLFRHLLTEKERRLVPDIFLPKTESLCQ
jgi:hypothetical protein